MCVFVRTALGMPLPVPRAKTLRVAVAAPVPCRGLAGLYSFTIIAPGPSDIDQDGPALVGDPDMGFVGLRQFGPTLTHHTELKVGWHRTCR